MKKPIENIKAVKMMREIRDSLGIRYYKNTKLLMEDLKAIRKKYNINSESKITISKKKKVR